MTLPERIQAKITPVTESGCWLWMGAIGTGGYARVFWQGKNSTAHRVVYQLLRGPISKALTLDHLCRVRCCVNPDHLEPVSLRVNIKRGEGIGVQNERKTHCPAGHPYNEKNTYFNAASGGGRICRPCNNLHTKHYKDRKRGVL